MRLKKRRQLVIYRLCLSFDMLGKILRVHLTCDYADVAIAIGNGVTNNLASEFASCGNEDGLLATKLWMREKVGFVSPCFDDHI